MESLIFSLNDPVKFCIIPRNLPNNGIKFDDVETLNPSSFPGWPSFGDILCHGSSKQIVGVTFHVPKQHRADAKRLADKLSPAIVNFRDLDDPCNLGIYEECPGSAWFELKWSTIAPDRFIAVQTSDILWYPMAGLHNESWPIAVGIEHLANFTESADYGLMVPREFPYPEMKIEFLND